MTALPLSSDFNASTVNEGQFHTATANLLAFLSGILGTTGTVATALATLGALAGTYAAKTAVYTVQLADRGQVIDATTGSWTLSLPTVASAGAGFSLVLRNSGAGVITIDPSGAELVDAAATLAVPAGQAVMIICTGTVWVSHWMMAAAFTSTTKGLVPASGGGTTNFLRADGSFAQPATLSDATFVVQDNVDATKQVKVEVSGVTTATTRTLTVPDASGTLDLTNNVATLSNKSIDLGSNTLTTTKAQLNAAIAGDDAVFLSSINGPVSMDSAGAATGAVIEEGVNKNGRYVKFSNGWMICTRTAFVMGRCATADGSSFKSATMTWTFPVAFATEPFVNGMTDDVDVEIGAAAPTTTSVVLRSHSATSKSVVLSGKLTAIGRWTTIGAASPAVPSGLKFWYDLSDASTLFQDTAATTPVTQPTDPVGRINDKSGSGYNLLQATSTKRPLYQIDSDGHGYIQLDGVDDFLSAAGVDFSATNQLTVLVAIRRELDAVVQSIVELGPNANTTSGTFLIGVGAATTLYATAVGGTSIVTPGATSGATPSLALLTLQDAIGTPSAILRLNGAQVTSNAASQGTGNFTSQTLYVGMRAGTTRPFTGRIYGLIAYTGVLSAADTKAVEDWLNQRAGVF